MKIPLLKSFQIKLRLLIPCLALVCFTMSGAWAQERTVSGTLTSVEDGQPLPGVSVVLKGTSIGTVTDIDGKYKISVPSDGGVIVYSFIGLTTKEVEVNNQSVIDVQMEENVLALSEVVVTGYTTQRKKDITGAVSVVEPEELKAVAAASFTQQLEGRAAGVTVGTSGAPGAGVNVRIRGISTFGNNDPLVVVDGVQMNSAYMNSINPNDIESIQILKDASAASIYGSRASNGVIIITTKKGHAGETKVSYDAYHGSQTVGRTMDLLNPTEYADMIWQSYGNANQTPPSAMYGDGASPVLPNYIWPSGAMTVDESTYSNDPSNLNLITRANQEGTDWYDEIFRSAPISSHNINISGGTDKSRFNLGMNYFDQEGTVIHNYFKRGTIRANSEFKVKDAITVGENFQISFIEEVGIPGGNQNEGNPISMAYRMQSIVPVYDIAGNFAGAKGANLGNANNPVAQLYRNKDNKGRYARIFGNVFAQVDFLKDFSARTSLGIDYGTGYRYAFNFRNIEAAEPSASNSYNEHSNYNFGWIWTNTLNYSKTIGDLHNVTALVGYEALLNQGRGLGGSRANYFTTTQTAWGLNSIADPASQTNYSYAYFNALASAFGRIDYTYNNKYLVNVTVRQDGSSRFGDEKYATFPAASIGWRVSQEGFLQNVDFIDDLKIRYGWGKTGNQYIRDGNAYSIYGGGPGRTFYDLGGTNNSIRTGYAQISLGNPGTRWESQTSNNIGLDASLFAGKLEIILDVYKRVTEDLLFNPALPGTAGLAQPPYINIGSMQNKGIDLAINNRGIIAGGLTYDIGFNISHYKNEILTVSGTESGFFTSAGSRFGNIAMNQPGGSMGQFYGFQILGIFQNQAEVDAAPAQAGAGVGRFRFADVNGRDSEGLLTGLPDGIIDDADRTFIGNPHPDFTYGFNLGLNYKGFDFTTFFQGVYGNDIYNYTKWWTDFNSFQGNRSQRMLDESWTPERGTSATLPMLDASDDFSNSVSHSYYVEKGSYLRARNVQLGYTLPHAKIGKVGLDNLRLYVQAQNLFTITNYSGMDPAISQQGFGENSDRTVGIDYGNYPTPKTYLLGVSATF
ncbi:MAG: SusC/RagA family TonB-linked outer membrane protein [Candidatus Cyclobacteriaceae bacterium M2_1C_046]